MDYNISEADIQNLSKQIKANLPPANFAAGANVSFCANWSEVKAALTALQGLLSAIPGASIFAKPAIAIVLAAGEAAHQAICN